MFNYSMPLKISFCFDCVPLITIFIVVNFFFFFSNNRKLISGVTESLFYFICFSFFSLFFSGERGGEQTFD